MEIPGAYGIECAFVSGCDRAWENGVVVGEMMEERGHMPRCSRIVELNLHLWWLRLWHGSISDLLIIWLISNIVVDLLDCSLDFNIFVYCNPCFNVCVGCVRIIVIAVVVAVAIVVAIAVVIAIVIAIAVVIVVVVPLRQGLSFLSASFTSAFRLDVSLLATIVAFNCAIHLPVLSHKGLIWAVITFALGDCASIVLICDDFSDVIRGNGLASHLGHSIHAARGGGVSGGKGSEQDCSELFITKCLPHS